jgi:octaprenyl-diphosphate synthase
MDMTETEKLLNAVRLEAANIDRAMHADLESIRPSVDPLLIDVLEYGLFNGGKRIRPLLVVLAARLCGRRDDSIYQLGMAFEYIHAATLFHDDVIDNAQIRRGRPAVNRQFGLVAAILAGDFLHARSMEIVGKMAGSDALRIFCEATAGMVDGEFMQLRNASQANLSELDYYEAIMGKTGLLIAASCEVGALYGGADQEQQKALRSYGVGLGCAFQMIDDLLDYTGDQKKTGKKVGNDLAEGKMTLPLIVALSRADGKDRSMLENALHNQAVSEEEFQAVTGIIRKYEGFSDTRKQAEDTVREAVSRLALFTDLEADQDKAILTGLAGYILTREK